MNNFFDLPSSFKQPSQQNKQPSANKGKQPFDSTILEILECPNRHPCSMICSSSNCLNSALCCDDEDCQYNLAHQNCNLKRIKPLVKKIKDRLIDHKPILDLFNKKIDQFIDQVSRIRDQAEQYIKNYGLKQSQIDFLQILKSSKTQKLTGRIVHSVDQVSSSVNKVDFDQSINKINQYWEKNGSSMTTLLLDLKDQMQMPLHFKEEKLLPSQINHEKMKDIKGIFKGDQIKEAQQRYNKKVNQYSQKLFNESRARHPPVVSSEPQNLMAHQPEVGNRPVNMWQNTFTKIQRNELAQKVFEILSTEPLQRIKSVIESQFAKNNTLPSEEQVLEAYFQKYQG